MDVTISTEHFSQFLTSPLGVTLLIGVVTSVAVLIAGSAMASDASMNLGACSSVFLVLMMVIGAIGHAEDQERAAVASTLATISDQYEISDLMKSGDGNIGMCYPGSSADQKPYSWLSKNPKALHEGVLVKTAEADGSCTYTLYSQSQVTPIAGG